MSEARVGETLTVSIEVRDSAGVLVAPGGGTPTCSVTLPDGTTSSATVTGTAGSYNASLVSTIVGRYLFTWSASGSNSAGFPSTEFADVLPIALTYYVDLPIVRASLGISDSTDDLLIEQALAGASRGIDDYCDRTFTLATAATARRFRTNRTDFLIVDDIGSVTDLAVTIDGTTLEVPSAINYLTTAFEYAPDNALVHGRPITGFRAVNRGWYGLSIVVTARWGWPTVPQTVKQACLIQAVRLFRRKDSPDGIAGIADIGVMTMTRVDHDVKALLAPYAKVTIA